MSQLSHEMRDLVLHYAMRALPTEACSDVGAWLGLRLGRDGHPKAAARVPHVLTLLRPALADDPVALDAACTMVWRNVGRVFAEFSVLHRMLPEGRVRIASPDLLQEAAAGPLILCFLHVGNWEVLGEQLAALWPGRGLGVVMPPENRAHAFIARRRRKRLDAGLLVMQPGVWRHAADWLRRPDGMLWLAADEAGGGVPFLGRQAHQRGNLGKMVRLASLTGARILPVYAERLAGVRFVVRALPPITITADRRDPVALLAQTAALDAQLEPILRRFAEQWYMATAFVP